MLVLSSALLRLESEKSLMEKKPHLRPQGTMWKPGVISGGAQWGGLAGEVLREGLLIVTLIFTPLCDYSDVMVSALPLRALHFPPAAGGREDPAAGTEAPGTVLTHSCQGTGKVLLAWAGSILNPPAPGWLQLPWYFLKHHAENNAFRVIFRVPSKPKHHLPSFIQRFRKMETEIPTFK